MEKSTLKEARQAGEVSKREPEASELTGLKPEGIGMAVAFDWGLVVQILVTPFITLLLGQPGMFRALKLSPGMNALVSLLISLPFAALLAVFGEGVRCGWPLIAWRLSRPVTKRWFATVTSSEARKRHGGAWPWLILIWSIVGGVLQAIAATR